jgi:hypothetical protein
MAIDREKAIKEMSAVRLQGNSEGLIPAMGVWVQQLPTDFWNRFAAKMLNSVKPSNVPKVEQSLYFAAKECGYHTGHGIITSEEWKRVISPMIENPPEDVLHGAYAVFTAWGWADAEIVELVPEERMVVRALHYYESQGAKEYGINRPFAHMIRGVSAAFMDLAYGPPYPNGMGGFDCLQTKGVETGDPYGEFIVTKN